VKLGHLILTLVVTGILVPGCGSNGGEPESIEKLPPPLGELPEVKVTLDGKAGPANVAILMAMERGFFTDVGMEVWEGAPLLPSRPVNYTTSPTIDLGITQQPQVPIAKENGAPIVAVGSLVSEPTAAMIWLAKSKIRGISDLRDKTIATPGIPYEEDLLESILKRAGLTLDDVNLKRAAYELVPALLNGRVDAIFGGSWNLEGVTLRKRGAKPVIRKVQELGVPDYEELVMITRTDRAAEKPKMIRDFISAVVRGAAAAVEDPEGAFRVIEENNERDFEATPAITRAQLEATLPLLSQSAHMDIAQAGDLVAWMQEQEIIRTDPAPSKLFTNDYLVQP
jgi:ABC-type nitrate/sulfonate/bicarbonate transport system substrate-binding protein